MSQSSGAIHNAWRDNASGNIDTRIACPIADCNINSWRGVMRSSIAELRPTHWSTVSCEFAIDADDDGLCGWDPGDYLQDGQMLISIDDAGRNDRRCV